MENTSSTVAIEQSPYRALPTSDRPLPVQGCSGPSRARNMEVSTNSMHLEQSNCLELGPMIQCYCSPPMGTRAPHTHAHPLLGAVSICRDRDYKIWKKEKKSNQGGKNKSIINRIWNPRPMAIMVGPLMQMAAATHCRLAEYNCISVFLTGPDCPQRLVASRVTS